MSRKNVIETNSKSNKLLLIRSEYLNQAPNETLSRCIL